MRSTSFQTQKGKCITLKVVRKARKKQPDNGTLQKIHFTGGNISPDRIKTSALFQELA